MRVQQKQVYWRVSLMVVMRLIWGMSQPYLSIAHGTGTKLVRGRSHLGLVETLVDETMV